MRHQKKNRKFGLVRKVRRALLKGLSRSLIKYERIKTTEAKAKELRPLVERLVTKSKIDTIHHRRRAARLLGKEETKKIFTEIAPRYLERSGGYTRIVKLQRRKKDDARMAIIEFI
ncbi:MAG: 50S ribosomal protein L17 [Candidatus Niyogibacteria bacterium]|nr:50S ribosomal protein L17 [Candidatus Niyogibacteria bacterium]